MRTVVAARCRALASSRYNSTARHDGGDVGLDHADLARCLPAVDDGSRSAPFARVQRPLDPLTTQGALDPNTAIAAIPATTLLAVGTGLSVPTPESQTAGRHAQIVAESRRKVSASFLPTRHILIGSVDSIGRIYSMNSRFDIPSREMVRTPTLSRQLPHLRFGRRRPASSSGFARRALLAVTRHESHPLRQTLSPSVRSSAARVVFRLRAANSCSPLLGTNPTLSAILKP